MIASMMMGERVGLCSFTQKIIRSLFVIQKKQLLRFFRVVVLLGTKKLEIQRRYVDTYFDVDSKSMS